VEAGVVRPVMDGAVDGDDEVQEEHGQYEEMEGRVPAGVGFVALQGGHNSPSVGRIQVIDWHWEVYVEFVAEAENFEQRVVMLDATFAAAA